jgi:Tol biopolymer transport system component
MASPVVSRPVVLGQLERMLASETFSGAGRSGTLLRFLVEHALDGHSEPPKEYTIGAEVLGRGASFDPRTDPIVRAEASRLRGRIERYYAAEGAMDTVLIALPKGAYAPSFGLRDTTGSVASHGRGRAWPQRLGWFALGGVTVGVLLALAGGLRSRRSTAPLFAAFEFDIELARGELSLGSDFGCDLALSPDGTRLVYVVRGPDGQLRLAARELGRPTSVELPGTEGARIPFFSPDGRWVAFWALGKLKKTSVDGGSPVELAEAVDFGGGSWAEDGQMIVALSRALVRVPASPGTPAVIADFAAEGLYPRWPQALPGGSVLFTAIGQAGPNAATIQALSLATGRRSTLLKGGSYARVLANGYLVYVNQGTLFALPFDAARLEQRGPAVPTLESVQYAPTFGFAQVDVARNGTAVYRRSPGRGQLAAAWVDDQGRVEVLPVKPGAYAFPRLSPDGKSLALGEVQGGALGTVVYDLRHATMTRLPPGPGLVPGVWSPDGRFLVLGSARGMFWTRADDLTKVLPLTKSERIQTPYSFSPDGARLAYHDLGLSTAFDLWTVPVRTSGGALRAGEPQVLLQTRAYETYASVSPDGRWFSHGSGEYGVWDVYVRPFPPDERREVRVSDGGGRIARWLAGRQQLVYRSDDQRLMIVDYTASHGSFVPGKPRPWIREQLADTGVIANFDVRPDGRGVVALLPAARDEDRQTRNRATVVLNFFDEVSRRAPRAAARP